jgi:hypothetical protein
VGTSMRAMVVVRAIAVSAVAILAMALALFDTPVAHAEAAGLLSVHPTSGAVGSTVTIDATGFQLSNCGQIVFEPIGGSGPGIALGGYHEALVPGFVGTSPSVPVSPGHYQFAVSCEDSPTTSGFVTYTAPFTVTSSAVATSRFVGMATTSDGRGYWLAQAGGGIYSFGDAVFHGSLPAGPGGLGITPAASIVGIASTPDGGGYWLVGADGGVFSFGDASFYGSLPEQHIAPAAPIVGIAPASDGKGYWLVGADGGVFAFGDAPYCTTVARDRPRPPARGLCSGQLA